MPTPSPAPRKPGRPAGQSNPAGHAAGRRPLLGATAADAELLARAGLLSHRYNQPDLLHALGMGRAAWANRRDGRGSFTPAQLEAGRAFLNAVSPAPWGALPPGPEEGNRGTE